MPNKPLIFVKFLNKEYLQSLLEGNTYVSNATTMREIERKNGGAGQGDALEAVLQLIGDQAYIFNDANNTYKKAENVRISAIIDSATRCAIFCVTAICEEDCNINELRKNRIIVRHEIEDKVRKDFPNADTAVVFYEPHRLIDCMSNKGYIGSFIHYQNMKQSRSQNETLRLIEHITVNPGTKEDIDKKIMSWRRQDTCGRIIKEWYLTRHNSWRILMCKDDSFYWEREYRFVNPKINVIEPHCEFIGFGKQKIKVYGLDEFFNGIDL